MGKIIKVSFLYFCLGFLAIAMFPVVYAGDSTGLVGIQYGSEDFTDPENVVVLDSLGANWDQDSEFGRQWSGKWQGYVVAQGNGQINFTASSDQALKVEVDGLVILDTKQSVLRGTIGMEISQKYPVIVTYVKTGDEYECNMQVNWSWMGQEPVAIAGDALVHSDQVELNLANIVDSAEDEDEDEDDGDDNDDEDEGAVAALEVILAQNVDPSLTNMPGLVGVICEGEDFDRPASIDIIKHANHNWTGGPGNWSGYWQGYIEAPATGEVKFTAEVDNGIKLAVGKHVIIDGLSRRGARQGSITMVKGRKYPLYLWYFQDGDPSYLRLYWSWPGQDKTIINENMFSYSPADNKFALDMLPIDYWDEDAAPLKFDGTGSEPLDLAYQDGKLLPVVGVQNYQAVRSNREHSDWVGGLSKTYLHAPMMSYWKGKYWLEFLSAPVNEHDPNTETYMTSSVDGKNWEAPRLIFPSFKPLDDKNLTICHQRMGFYVSKDNRLLILAFYGKYPSPNEGDGIGRAVREVYEDGSVGPLYFIRYNRHAGYNESNTPFPFYKTSNDKGFVAICDGLMANKLMVQQWWEEDRSEDGFYTLSGENFACKAFIWYKRNDGVTVGLFKAGYSVYSTDDGKTWSENKPLPSVIVGHAKMWGQRTDDGKFAFVHNPHFEWRYPLVVCTSNDGEHFGNMACVHGELNPMRYQGDAKDVGPQYVRGISPGNGNPPGNDMWLTYSQHKEDIWVSKVPLPIRSRVDDWVDDNFDKLKAGSAVKDWNIYSSIWAPVNVSDYPNRKNKSLMFKDKEPYDYARAVRVIPVSKTVAMSFDITAKKSDAGRMEIEILSKIGKRPVRIILKDDGKIYAVTGDGTVEICSYRAGKKYKISVEADVAKSVFSVKVNRKKVVDNAGFAESAKELQRVSFRTGEYRKLGIGKDENADDLPNAGEPVTEAVYYLDNVKIRQ